MKVVSAAIHDKEVDGLLGGFRDRAWGDLVDCRRSHNFLVGSDMGLTVRQLRLTTFAAIAGAAMSAAGADLPQRHLYAVNESAPDRGSISIYDIDADHRLLKTIRTVSNVDDVRGVTGSAVTGKLYVGYRDTSGSGMLCCLEIYQATVLWNRKVPPGVDRLASNPDGKLLYVPTWEGETADYIQVLDAKPGDLVRRVDFSSRSHDTQYPLAGPVFQTTKADDGSGGQVVGPLPLSYSWSAGT